MSEPELIKRCLDKDKKAWGVFVDKYSRLVYWAIQRRLGLSNFKPSQADIDDIFQEVFLTILEDEKLRQLKEPKNLSGWIAMVASRRTIDFMRQKLSRREDFNVDNLRLSVGTKNFSPRQDDTEELVREVIDNLPDKERTVISLNLLEGKTHKEIGEMLNMPINTVSTIISRTKEKVKATLEDIGIDENF